MVIDVDVEEVRADYVLVVKFFELFRLYESIAFVMDVQNQFRFPQQVVRAAVYIYLDLLFCLLPEVEKKNSHP